MSAAEGFEEFVTIVETGSLTAAAEALGVPRPTLSRRLARLEARLGVRLLHRTTRRLKMTLHGETLYARAHRVVRTAREVEAELQRLDGVPRGRLRVSVPTEMPPALLSGWVAEYLSACPEVQLELVASNQHIDLIEEGIDVALRSSAGPDPSLVIRTLASNLRVAVATPAYLAACGTPETLADLRSHNCIRGYDDTGLPDQQWPLLDGGTVQVSGNLTANQMGQRLSAARRDIGIALIVERIAARELAEGSLVRVLPDLVGHQERLCLAYPERNLVDPKVRAFLDLITDKISTILQTT